MAGNAGYTTPSFIGWGGANGYNTAATPALPGSAPSNTIGTGQWSDVAPFQEFSEARVAGTLGGTSGLTNATSGSGTVGYVLTGTLTASVGESVGESFLVMSSTKPTTFTISGNVAVTNATMTVTTSGGVIGAYYQMNNEVVLISNTAASNIWSITRAQNGSVAGTAKSGDVVTFGNIPGAGANNPSKGDLFAHAGFQALALNSGDSIAFTWTVNVTS